VRGRGRLGRRAARASSDLGAPRTQLDGTDDQSDAHGGADDDGTDPDLQRWGLYLGILAGLGLSLRNGLKGWFNIYRGNEQYWSGVLWKYVGPAYLVLLIGIAAWILLRPAGPAVGHALGRNQPQGFARRKTAQADECAVDQRHREQRAHAHTLSYVAFGVGAAGLIAGGVTGVLALGKRSELSKACNSNGACRTNEQSDLNSYHTFGTVSGVGFGVGVAGVGVGIALWLINRDSAPAPAQGLVIRPYFDVASIGALGNF